MGELPDWWPSDKPWIISDVLEGLRRLPDGVVQCVVTSPPYWGLRQYFPDAVVLKENAPDWVIKELVEKHIYPANHTSDE